MRAASEPIINEESKEAFSNLADSAKRIWQAHSHADKACMTDSGTLINSSTQNWFSEDC